MLSPKKRAKIIDALIENPNAAQVARQVGGVGYRTVLKIARQEGIELTAGKTVNNLSPEARAKIVAALKANPNASAVTRQVGGASSQTVRKIAKRAGVDLAAAKAARCALPPEKRAKIIAALKANPNASAVTRQVGGVSYATVLRIAKQTGIKLSVGRPARGCHGAEQKAPAEARHAQNS
jgi:phosphoribosylformylglycinamidine (FGAM) synthase PurS component